MEESSLKNFVTPGVRQTIFNWAISLPVANLGQSEEAFKTMDYVPSVSGKDASQLWDVLGASNPHHVRTFNEPEIQGQDTMSPQEGHSIWVDYIEPALKAHPNVVALSPAITGSELGMSWLASFTQLCNGGCSFKKLDVHFYVLSLKDVTPVMDQLHNTYNMPIWVTEFGCHDYSGAGAVCTGPIFATLYNDAMTYVAGTTWIEKFGWFGFFSQAEYPIDGVEAVNGFINGIEGSPDCSPNNKGHSFLNGLATF
jgi:hypothetical protein